ncbi:hypothetical protein D3C87_1843670 [compost metagenome]
MGVIHCVADQVQRYFLQVFQDKVDAMVSLIMRTNNLRSIKPVFWKKTFILEHLVVCLLGETVSK